MRVYITLSGAVYYAEMCGSSPVAYVIENGIEYRLTLDLMMLSEFWNNDGFAGDITNVSNVGIASISSGNEGNILHIAIPSLHHILLSPRVISGFIKIELSPTDENQDMNQLVACIYSKNAYDIAHITHIKPRLLLCGMPRVFIEIATRYMIRPMVK